MNWMDQEKLKVAWRYWYSLIILWKFTQGPEKETSDLRNGGKATN